MLVKIFKRSFILSFLFFFLSINIKALNVTSLPKEELVPGGIAIIEIPLESKKVIYNNNPVLICNFQNKKYTIIGIPLELENNIKNNFITQDIIISTENKNINKTFNVNKNNYPTSKITIKNTQMVKPNNTNLKRILDDQKIIIANYNSYNILNDNESLNLNINQPTKGIASSSFGSRRIINNIKKNPHKGMDIAASKGTAIYSPLPGKVILSKNLFLPGNTVIIDHGYGLKSLYAHLDKINVKPNQIIKKNYKIGTVGNTGRVTGPHLHWSMILNGEAVNPSLFLTKQKS